MHADDFDLGAHRFDVVGHARNQAAAANGHKHGVKRALVLAQHFHGDGALAGNHLGVVKRVHKGHAVLLLQRERVLVRVGVAVAVQHHLAAQGFDGFDLQSGGGHRHHDHGLGAQAAGTQRHALGMVAGRGADDALFQLSRREVHHLVVGAAQLETEHRLLVFALEQHGVVQTAAEVFGHFQRGLLGHVVDTCGQDFFQVVGGGQGVGFGRAGRHGAIVSYACPRTERQRLGGYACPSFEPLH